MDSQGHSEVAPRLLSDEEEAEIAEEVLEGEFADLTLDERKEELVSEDAEIDAEIDIESDDDDKLIETSDIDTEKLSGYQPLPQKSSLILVPSKTPMDKNEYAYLQGVDEEARLEELQEFMSQYGGKDPILKERFDEAWKIPRPADMFIEPYFSRQPFEKWKHYNMFLTYYSLPPKKRTIAAAFRKWRGIMGEKRGATRSFYIVAKHWRWKERVELADAKRARYLEQIWIERELQRREEDWGVGGKVRKKGMDALRQLELDDIPPAVVIQMLKVASDLQKEAVPKVSLRKNDVQRLLANLPKDNKDRVLRILMAEYVEHGE